MRDPDGLRGDSAVCVRRVLSTYAPAGFAACEPCALTLGIPVYVPVARADAHALAHTGTDAYARTLTVCAAVADADR